ncbi:MAG: GNAT family N-acetyltransferase [Leptospirales bacterium]|nr:GNAT family N-acetyltransferase [Leptospirales bacterium]
MKEPLSGIIFRKIIEGDLHSIYSEGLNEPEFIDLPFAWDSGNIAKVFASEGLISFAALKKKKVIGFIFSSIENEKSYLHWIMVNERFRKIGIGKELIRLFIESSKEKGVEKFLTSPLKNSHKIINFFSNNGFSVKETYIEFYR